MGRHLSSGAMNFAFPCLLLLSWLHPSLALRHNKFAVSGFLGVGWETCSQFNIFQLHARIPWHLARCSNNSLSLTHAHSAFGICRCVCVCFGTRHWNTNFKLNFCGLSLFTSGIYVRAMSLPLLLHLPSEQSDPLSLSPGMYTALKSYKVSYRHNNLNKISIVISKYKGLSKMYNKILKQVQTLTRNKGFWVSENRFLTLIDFYSFSLIP